MLEKKKYWQPLLESFLIWFTVIAIFYLFKLPIINADGIHFIDWSDPILIRFIVGAMIIGFILLQLIPGLLLVNNYLKNDKEAIELLSNYKKDEFTSSINEVVKVSSYLGGNTSWWNRPSGILADYFYYRFHMDNQVITVSNLLFKDSGFFKGMTFQPRHVFSPLPLVREENWFDLKEKKSTPQPSENLIQGFEKKYRSYSTSKLKKYISSEGFRKEAKIAAKNILEERKE